MNQDNNPPAEVVAKPKTFDECKAEVAKKYNIGSTLVTGHLSKYWEEAALLFAEIMRQHIEQEGQLQPEIGAHNLLLELAVRGNYTLPASEEQMDMFNEGTDAKNNKPASDFMIKLARYLNANHQFISVQPQQSPSVDLAQKMQEEEGFHDIEMTNACADYAEGITNVSSYVATCKIFCDGYKAAQSYYKELIEENERLKALLKTK